MRRALTLLTALAVLTACEGGDERPDAATETNASTAAPSATETSPAPESDPLADVCAEHCSFLLEAQDAECPEPSNNVSLCVPYLTELSRAVYAVRDALDETPYASRDHAELLEAVNSNIEAVEQFAADKCFQVTSATTTDGFACGLQPLGIIWSAATVGLRLDGGLS